jgi:putative transposase
MRHKTQSAPDEWYHCYNRGVEKISTFASPADYQRFTLHMWCANTNDPVHISNMHRKERATIYTDPPFSTAERLVDIGAYALMPNHFHILLREVTDGGVSKFMQKLLTGYTMYFNKRFERTGPLFSGGYKSIHVDSDHYMRHVYGYIHLNPASLFDPLWFQRSRREILRLKQKLIEYPYSSLGDHMHSKMERPEAVLIEQAKTSLPIDQPSLNSLIDDAIEFYRTSTKVRP